MNFKIKQLKIELKLQCLQFDKDNDCDVSELNMQSRRINKCL